MTEVSRESETKGESATQAWGKNKPIPGAFYTLFFSQREIRPAIVLGATKSG